jgi:hypothetical protein
MFPIGETTRDGKNISTIIFLRGFDCLRSKAQQDCSKAVKTKDMGVFLYAIYLFVKSSVRENKSYVKSVTNSQRIRRVVYRNEQKVKG